MNGSEYTPFSYLEQSIPKLWSLIALIYVLCYFSSSLLAKDLQVPLGPWIDSKYDYTRPGVYRIRNLSYEPNFLTMNASDTGYSIASWPDHEDTALWWTQLWVIIEVEESSAGIMIISYHKGRALTANVST